MAMLEQQPHAYSAHIYLPRNSSLLQQFASIRPVTTSGGRSDAAAVGPAALWGLPALGPQLCTGSVLSLPMTPSLSLHPAQTDPDPSPLPTQPHSTAPSRVTSPWHHCAASLTATGTGAQTPLPHVPTDGTALGLNAGSRSAAADRKLSSKQRKSTGCWEPGTVQQGWCCGHALAMPSLCHSHATATLAVAWDLVSRAASVDPTSAGAGLRRCEGRVDVAGPARAQLQAPVCGEHRLRSQCLGRAVLLAAGSCQDAVQPIIAPQGRVPLARGCLPNPCTPGNCGAQSLGIPA